MLRIAIVGFGWWGKHIAVRLGDNSKLRPVLVVEKSAERRSEIEAMGLEAATELSEALARPDIDAVVLATPNTLHEEQVVACARAGKHVYCEKPLGLTGASARRSVQACVDAGVRLGIGHERRFEPAMQALAEMVSKGELGVVMHAESAFSHDKLKAVPSNDWRTSKAVSPAGGMTAMGVHLTDLYIAMFGPVRTVQALTASRVLGWETGDVTTVQLEFEAGMTATLSAVLCTPHFIRMHVFGSEKWVEIRNDTHPDTPGGIATMTAARSGAPHDTVSYDWTDTVVANLEAFADAAQRNGAYPHTHEEMIHNIEVLEAIAISAEEGRTIHMQREDAGR